MHAPMPRFASETDRRSALHGIIAARANSVCPVYFIHRAIHDCEHKLISPPNSTKIEILLSLWIRHHNRPISFCLLFQIDPISPRFCHNRWNRKKKKESYFHRVISLLYLELIKYNFVIINRYEFLQVCMYVWIDPRIKRGKKLNNKSL